MIRKAVPADEPAIAGVYAKARDFMKEHGNPDQWGSQYPPEDPTYRVILTHDGTPRLAYEKV